jgi:hypothetical protein
LAIDDRVQALKMEDPSTGGDSTDPYPTALDRNEDYLDCRGVTLQSTSSNDASVIVSRDSSNNLTFTDPVVATTYTLSALVGGGYDINNVIWDNAGGIVYDRAGIAVTRT